MTLYNLESIVAVLLVLVLGMGVWFMAWVHDKGRKKRRYSHHSPF